MDDFVVSFPGNINPKFESFGLVQSQDMLLHRSWGSSSTVGVSTGEKVKDPDWLPNRAQSVPGGCWGEWWGREGAFPWNTSVVGGPWGRVGVD